MQKLTSKDNPRVRRYQKLASSKKERRASGQFVLEGVRLVADGVQNGAEISYLLGTAQGFGALAERVSFLDIPAWEISERLASSLSDTAHPQGVFAVCAMPAAVPLDALLARGRRFAILCMVQDPGNMGMILRSADALGMDGVICCGCCDVYAPKVVRAAMGSIFRVPVVLGKTEEQVLEMCKSADVLTYASVPDKDAQLLQNCRFSGKCALLIGNEGNGLPRDIIEKCDKRVTIPMHGKIESLNAAVAAGILMWEMGRDAGGGA